MTRIEIKNIIKDWAVLFVDDEEFVVDTMREILPMLFAKSYFALNGIEGIELSNKYKIDLIITDLSMPKMNGIDMITKIKQLYPDIKIICVSGHNESNFIEDSKKLDAEFIIKPISSSVLYKAIEKII